MYTEILESVMSIYDGRYNKTFEELKDSVKGLLVYYENRLNFLDKAKDASYDDIRFYNMRKSAFESCRHTVSMLNTLSNDLNNPEQIAYFKKKRDIHLSNSKQSTTSSQIKLF